MAYKTIFWGCCVVSLGLGAACVGDDPTLSPSPPVTPGTDAASPTDPGSDAAIPPGPLPDRCDGPWLVTGELRTRCDFGCRQGDGGVPYCATFEPTGPVTAGDLKITGLVDLLLDGVKLNFQTGEILRGETVVRQASNLAQPELKNGIRFWRTADAFVIQAQNIVVAGTTPTLATDDSGNSEASMPLVLVANQDIRVEAAWHLPCGLLGGGAGGGGINAAETRLGSGESTRMAAGGGALGGGGGGRHGSGGGFGGMGRTSTTLSYGGGSVLGTLPSILMGGPGGGGSGGYGQDPNGGTSYALTLMGGAGGGALQMIAGRSITFDATSGQAGINAGGCGGGGSDAPEYANRNVAGAGGGAGGFVILEAPQVTGVGAVTVAANGGGGGGRGWGQDGKLSAAPASGASEGTCVAAGGAGGAGAEVQGTAGQDVTTPIPPACTAGRGGGGGGGAAGRIAIYTLNGSGPDGAGFTVSPSGPGLRLGTLTAEP